MRKIRKGDKVQVISGKDKGRIGSVLAVMKPNCPKTGLRVIVQGVNIKKKCVKPNPQRQEPGGIIPRELSIPICKVALFDSTTNKPGRVGIKMLADGKKVRYFKSSGEVVDVGA